MLTGFDEDAIVIGRLRLQKLSAKASIGIVRSAIVLWCESLWKRCVGF
jgi:hypothetical protein